MRVSIGACVPALVSLLAAGASGGTVSVTVNEPAVDRWMYPFGTTGGSRDNAPVFSSLDTVIPGFTFDNRDAQQFLRFSTGGQVPVGAGVCGYRIVSAAVTLTLFENVPFVYDSTYDSFRTYLPAGDPMFVADADAGRPIEMHGAAYRGGLTDATYVEGNTMTNGTPFRLAPGPGGGQDYSRCRTVFPIDFTNGTTTAADHSNNINNRFDTKPFAIGQIPGVTPGMTPAGDSDVVFTLNVADADVQAYLRDALNTGSLRLMVDTLHFATTGGQQPGTGSYPTFYTKENALGQVLGYSPRLSMLVELDPLAGDANGDGRVDLADIADVVQRWDAAYPNPGRQGDVNCDGFVNLADIAAITSNWGAGT